MACQDGPKPQHCERPFRNTRALRSDCLRRQVPCRKRSCIPRSAQARDRLCLPVSAAKRRDSSRHRSSGSSASGKGSSGSRGRTATLPSRRFPCRCVRRAQSDTISRGESGAESRADQPRASRTGRRTRGCPTGVRHWARFSARRRSATAACRRQEERRRLFRG